MPVDSREWNKTPENDDEYETNLIMTGDGFRVERTKVERLPVGWAGTIGILVLAFVWGKALWSWIT